MPIGLPTRSLCAAIASLAIIGLSGCSSQYALQSPTTYVEASSKTSLGYSSVQLTPTTHRVMFTASQVTGPVKVQEYAMQRAAEIAQAGGYSAFTVFDSDAVLEKPQRSATRDVTINRTVPPERQCTMSGCSEVGEQVPMTPAESYSLSEEESGMIHYSMVIRLGDAKAFSQADIEFFNVQSVLEGEFGPALKPRQVKS